MLKKILTWLLVVIVLLISGLYVTIVMRQNRTFKAPTPDIKASTDSAIIERGKYLAYGHIVPIVKLLLVKKRRVTMDTSTAYGEYLAKRLLIVMDVIPNGI